MTRRTIAILLSATYILGCVALAFALGDGNYRKGKYLFRKHCRSCHMENAPGAEQAKVLEPITFTMDEWTAAFAPEKAAGYKCKAEWDKVGAEGINDIYTYLHKFAKDSPTPAKCK